MRSMFRWPSEVECAVSLTYDDALPSHATHVAPALERYGLRATFYVPIMSDVRDHPDRWRQVAAAGHELGNHTVFHPCRRVPPEQYAWLDPSYDLSSYSPARLRAELDVANFVLQLLDGQTERTFGNTCCDTTIGQGADEQPIESILADRFVAARGALTNRVARPHAEFNLLNIGCIAGDGRTFAELEAIIETARRQRGWAIIMLHGIGAGTHDLYLDTDVHQQLLAWLAAQQPAIWAAPVVEIARYMSGHAGQVPASRASSS
jgi:peptidoglycan/xylan/chitin deacetylase (PgdA/CDA1 family)